jgi:methionyl-tRNA formyltransferase
MKIVLLSGNAPNQLAGIVLEKRIPRKSNKSFSKILDAVLDRTLFKELRNSWFSMMEHYRNIYTLPDVPILEVSNINHEPTIDFLKKLNPDLIMVSGTSMVKKGILSMKFTHGIINLHTGLSPYVKGGPNCTNWCLAENQFHLIGNTVMWIDEGIDSGDLILTEPTSLSGDESLEHLHLRVMEHAHELYLRSVRNIRNGVAAHVKQTSIAEGKTFFTREWKRLQKWRAVRNYKKFHDAVASAEFRQKRDALKLVQ